MKTDNTLNTQFHLRKAVVDWLCKSGNKIPDGFAFDVCTRKASDKLDLVSANFSKSISSSKTQLRLAKKVICKGFLCYSTRKECWNDCANAEEIVANLRILQEERAKLEEQIRKNEPELKESQMLFEELATWEYGKSTNKEYHALMKNINWLENILYLGNKIERIVSRPICDEYYVVVPEGLISPKELNEAWGLLWMQKDGSIQLQREPTAFQTEDADKLFLIKKLLESNTKDSINALKRRIRKADRQTTKDKK